MWDPEQTLWQVGSYEEKITPPGAEAGCGTLVTAWWNSALTGYVLGALTQLLQQPTWNTTDPATLSTVQAQITDLIGNIANAAGTAYPSPTPISVGDSACRWLRNAGGAFILNGP